MNRNFTPKQIEKYRRQKYISALNKCTKNLYNLFKNPKTTLEDFHTKFTQLKSEISIYENDVYLNSDALKRVKEYIDNLYTKTILNKNFDLEQFNSIKEIEISNLNRLQKMKNRTKYSKEKYKNSFE